MHNSYKPRKVCIVLFFYCMCTCRRPATSIENLKMILCQVVLSICVCIMYIGGEGGREEEGRESRDEAEQWSIVTAEDSVAWRCTPTCRMPAVCCMLCGCSEFWKQRFHFLDLVIYARRICITMYSNVLCFHSTLSFPVFVALTRAALPGTTWGQHACIRLNIGRREHGKSGVCKPQRL